MTTEVRRIIDEIRFALDSGKHAASHLADIKYNRGNVEASRDLERVEERITNADRSLTRLANLIEHNGLIPGERTTERDYEPPTSCECSACKNPPCSFCESQIRGEE